MRGLAEQGTAADALQRPLRSRFQARLSAGVRFPGEFDMSFAITSIPKIMRHRGWGNGARLMEIWFSRASVTAPAYGSPETQTIRMSSWVLTFHRARAVYDQIMRERIWANPAARREVAAMLRKKGLLSSAPQSRPFGNLTAPVPLLDTDYVNQRVVGFSLSDLDDMAAALGNFAFRIVVAGGVMPIPKSPRFKVTISEVGVYVRDSYDFNGSQFLGFWDDKDNSVSMTNPLSGTSISNDDFRSWRAKTGKGGDFLIFSDLLKTRLPNPDLFDI